MAFVRDRAAYRAIYLSSPLKCCTTLHAFSHVPPRFHVDPWRKDRHAAERHKWRVHRQRKLGRWGLTPGPLAGVQVQGWPDPVLLGPVELTQAAARAQEEKFDDMEFWQQLAERACQLRDVLSVGDLTVILDALVTVDFRHLQLLKTLTRELIDDADKMMLVEVAVVANAYAHFNCFSAHMMEALADQAAAQLEDPLLEDPQRDLQSILVLVKACAALDFHHKSLLRNVNEAITRHAADISFAVLADLLAQFSKLGDTFEGDAQFWSACAAKVPGGRMAALCPTLRVLAELPGAEGPMRGPLVEEILSGLRGLPPEPPRAPLPVALGLHQREDRGHAAPLPTFKAPALPAFLVDALPALGHGSPRSTPASVPESQAAGPDGAVVEWNEVLEEGPVVVEDPQDEGGLAASPALAAKPRRWYNGTSRRPFPQAKSQYVAFDPSGTFARNRRGSLAAEALTGLGSLWGVAGSEEAAMLAAGSPPEAEVQLAEEAGPLLRSSVQGLSAQQLVSCAEVYAHPSMRASCRAVMQAILQEAVRKLSNLSAPELRRLHRAAASSGVRDPYLERAHRRFPLELRKELFGGGGDGAGAAAEAAEARP